MKRAMFMMMVALAMTAFPSMAQDASKFNGTWKGDGGQVRKLTLKDGVVFMEETQTNGRIILRQYPTKGQEITMTEGVWKDSKATGKMEGNKLVVDTTMPNGTKWHDEWTMAADGKTYAALRQMVAGANGAAGRGGGTPETFTKTE
jgi:anti-sigma factor ChrR (cupin superfamily)